MKYMGVDSFLERCWYETNLSGSETALWNSLQIPAQRCQLKNGIEIVILFKPI